MAKHDGAGLGAVRACSASIEKELDKGEFERVKERMAYLTAAST
jgi:hypothetical protein